jgi:hypothetical protein
MMWQRCHRTQRINGVIKKGTKHTASAIPSLEITLNQEGFTQYGKQEGPAVPTHATDMKDLLLEKSAAHTSPEPS